MQQKMWDQQDSQQRAAQIEKLIQELSSFSDPHARAVSEELLQTVLAMYGDGLARMLDIITTHTEIGPSLLDAFAEDEMVGPLLLLHGLHPIAVELRIQRALDKIRPALTRHGSTVEFLGVLDEVAYIRLRGNCHGCPSSGATMQQTIEEAIYEAAPEVIRIEAAGAETTRPQGMIGIPTRRSKVQQQ